VSDGKEIRFADTAMKMSGGFGVGFSFITGGQKSVMKPAVIQPGNERRSNNSGKENN
jgi:hypothetical protein